jgi:hypothetical protein
MRTTITIDDDLLKKVKFRALELNLSVSSYLESLAAQDTSRQSINKKSKIQAQEKLLDLFKEGREMFSEQKDVTYKSEEEVARIITENRRKNESWRQKLDR